MIKVFGHKVPDVDATISAIVMAWYLNEVKGEETEAFILGDLNKETEFVLSNWAANKPKMLDELKAGEKIWIVDTNNAEELLDGVEESTILGITDHHKISGNISTSAPIECIVKPVGCTSTILYLDYIVGNDVPDYILGLLLSAILSDTLHLTSSTTTELDKSVVEELTATLGVSADELAEKQFAAKSDISDLSDRALILSDAKDYEIGEHKTKVGVIETTLPNNVFERISGIIEQMKSTKDTEGLDYFFLFVVDIINGTSTPIFIDDIHKTALEKAFGTLNNGSVKHTLESFKAVSRKKELLPKIQQALE